MASNTQPNTTPNPTPNTCDILSADQTVSEFRRDFVCLNDSLHENLQDHPEVLLLYVGMVIFVMLFLKMVTRKPRGGGVQNAGKPDADASTSQDGKRSGDHRIP